MTPDLLFEKQGHTPGAVRIRNPASGLLAPCGTPPFPAAAVRCFETPASAHIRNPAFGLFAHVSGCLLTAD